MSELFYHSKMVEQTRAYTRIHTLIWLIVSSNDIRTELKMYYYMKVDIIDIFSSV